ncbi:rhomboid family intramembrane serine protease [Rudanella paleaurantiibacter]|uniref:Rhomboid family intramembrane serine protease n=1 Tax=Rudanella paleaurantiibacter TaxID=2614655 RepID=A0A7J5U1Z9_9BACT|nr:rhomboid family intramembrane serine protease [Rudanella paleaurantiibacter]KAB7731824.1 rhomboid family intramembrane serine protease [Rudanella paleaurantiibacter]
MSGLLDDFRSEFSKPNNTLAQLILVNVVVFLTLLILYLVFTVSESPAYYSKVVEQLTIPANAADFIRRPWTLITYFFTHEKPFHILFNMLGLYWFGRLVDEYLGARRLLGLYVLGGIAGGLLYLAMFNLVPYFVQRSGGVYMLGSSGAFFSVAVGAATLLPNYSFHLLFFGPVRIKYIVFFLIVLSLANSLGPNSGGELAHLGGAVMGFFFIKLLQNGTDLGRPIYWLMDGWQTLTRPKPAIKVSYRQRSNANANANTYAAAGASPGNASVSMPDQDEIDAILDKISRSGYESLSREEKQKLFRASQRS